MITAKKACWDKTGPLPVNLLILAAFLTGFSHPGARILTVVALIAWLAGCVRARRRPVMPMIGWLVMAYFAWITLALWWGPAENVSGSQLYKNLFWLNIPLTFALMTSTARRTRMLLAIAAGVGVQAIRTLIDAGQLLATLISRDVPFKTNLAIDQIIYHRALGGADLLGALISKGDMQSAQILAAGMFICIGAYHVVAPSTRARRWLMAVIAIVVVAMLLTFKRLAPVAVVMAALIFFTGWFMRGSSTRAAVAKTLAIVMAMAFAAGTLILGPPAGWSHKLAVAAKGGGRICMWTQVVPALVKEYPFGMGYKALTAEKMQSIARHVEKNRTHVHSNPLQALIDGGWPGLMLFLWIMIAHLRNHLRHLRSAYGVGDEWFIARALTLASLALMVAGLFEYQFGGSAQISLLYGLVMGTVAAGAATKPTPA